MASSVLASTLSSNLVQQITSGPSRGSSRNAAVTTDGSRRPGLRIAGVWDPFECAVPAVVGQQLSVRRGSTLAARLVRCCGSAIRSTLGLTYMFPTPAQLATANLRGVGLPRARATALRSLAREWTAQYVGLRALGEPDSFPASDLVLRRIAAGPDGSLLSVREMEQRAKSWRPWRGYTAVHLWQQQL
jgi:AraC family transcriptional regulator of adaptative response / DNA-3-methyladenine glycosylase II